MNSDYEKFLQGNDKSEDDKEDVYQHQDDFEQPQGDVNNKPTNCKAHAQDQDKQTPATSDRLELAETAQFNNENIELSDKVDEGSI